MKLKNSKIILSTILIVCSLSVLLLIMYFGTKFWLFSSPFSKKMDWILGLQEESYNFSEVIPGKLYRSKVPDEQFLRYVHEKYQIKTIISLSHFEDVHVIATELGIRVRLFKWSQKRLPPIDSLKYVIDIIDKNDDILLHCQGGSDRTGYTVAFYRIWRQNWELDQAVEEMTKHRHRPYRKKALHKEIEKLLEMDAIEKKQKVSLAP